MGVGTGRRNQAKLTPKRKEVFLKVLAETGSVAAAASAATPWSRNKMGGYATFRDAARRDPEFDLAWKRAEEEALAKVETEIMRRAMTPSRRPVFSKGQLVAYTDEYDNRLLVTLARRLNPAAWTEKQRIEHQGSVEHTHHHGVILLSASDVMLLSGEHRESLVHLLELVAQAKEGLNGDSVSVALPDSTSQRL